MNRPHVASKVRSIICSQLSNTPDAVLPSTHLELDLKADSLDLLEIGMALEEEFQITIEETVMARLKTFGDIVEHICEAKGVPPEGSFTKPSLRISAVGYDTSPAPTIAARDCRSCGAHSIAGVLCPFCGRVL